MITSVSTEKAHNSTPFCESKRNKLGMKVSLVKGFYEKPTTIIILSDERLKAFLVYLLSLLILKLVLEVLAELLG